MGKLLSIENLTVHYYTIRGIVKAVENVSFEIKEGEFFGLIGESGCGKSTIGNAIMRILPPSGRIINGKIIFRDKNLLELSEDDMRSIRGNEISMIFQDPTAALNPVLTIGDQIAEVIQMHRDISKKEALNEALRLLKTVRIPGAKERLNDYPHRFSGGMRQRVVIAIAIANNPKLIIADEPTTNLDVTLQAQILDLIDEIRQKMKSSILLITHNIGIIAEYSERVAVMYAGEIVEISNTEKLIDDPLHPYTAGLLNAIPGKGIRKEKIQEISGVVPDLVNPPSGCKFHPRCPYKMQICKENKPALNKFKNRYVACHLYNLT